MSSRLTLSLGTVLVALSLTATAAPDSSEPSVLVQTVKLEQGSAPRVVTAFGSVQADPSAAAAIVAPLAAVVGRLYVRTGMQVKKGAPLVQLLPSPQTTVAYTQAVSALQVTSSAEARTRELLAEALATKQQLADAEKAESDARAALAALQAQGASGAASLRAPFDAIVTTVTATERTLVAEGSALLELAPLNALVLIAGVVPDEAATIAPGDTVNVSPVGGGKTFAAKVALRGSVVDALSGLVSVQIPLPKGSLLPGQTAQAAITIGAVHGFVVPHEAILIDDDGNAYVVQVVAGVAKLVHVRDLGRQTDRDTIDGPLDLKAPLVVAGNHQLQDGMKVRYADSPGGASR